MAVTLKNLSTGETVSVQNVKNGGDHLVYQARLGVPREGWQNKNHVFADGFDAVSGGCILRPVDGWVIEGRKPRAPRAPQTEIPQTTEPTEQERVTERPLSTIATEPVSINLDGMDAAAQALFTPLFGGVINKIVADVNAKLNAKIAELQEVVEKKATRMEIKIGEKVTTVDGYKHKVFKRVLQRLAKGRHVYLWGPAGTGKSYLAKQMADALGIPFYSETTLQDPFDLKGFRDATGKYQETQFYQAVKFGGLYCLDEGDATAADVFVVINTVLANGYFSFPNGERLDCHPNFRFVCTANTCGLGATQEYNGRFKMDESSRDRFSFIYMGTDPEIELRKHAKGDKEIIEFAYAIRDAVKKASRLDFTCSSRAIAAIAEARDYDETPEETLESELLKGRTIDDIKTVVTNMRHLENNKWYNALLNIAANK